MFVQKEPERKSVLTSAVVIHPQTVDSLQGGMTGGNVHAPVSETHDGHRHYKNIIFRLLLSRWAWKRTGDSVDW